MPFTEMLKIFILSTVPTMLHECWPQCSEFMWKSVFTDMILHELLVEATSLFTEKE
jgi:hypothetical protein